MEFYPLQVFLMIASEKSFSRAAEKLLRTQPAVSLALQRLELGLGEKLIDRSAKDLVLTDAGGFPVAIDAFEGNKAECDTRSHAVSGSRGWRA